MATGKQAWLDATHGRQGGRIVAWSATEKSLAKCECGRTLRVHELDRGTCDDCAPDAPHPSLF